MEPLYFIQTAQLVQKEAGLLDHLIKREGVPEGLNFIMGSFDSLLDAMRTVNDVVRDWNSHLNKYTSENPDAHVIMEDYHSWFGQLQDIHARQRGICSQFIDIQGYIREQVGSALSKNSSTIGSLREEYVEYCDQAGTLQEVLSSIAVEHKIPQDLLHYAG